MTPCGFCESPCAGPWCGKRCEAAGTARAARGATVATIPGGAVSQRMIKEAIAVLIPEEPAPPPLVPLPLRRRQSEPYPAALREKVVARSQEVGIDAAAAEFGVSRGSVQNWRRVAGVTGRCGGGR